MATNRDGTPQGQPEQSMEDILASIRRLIVEDGQPGGGETRPEPAPGRVAAPAPATAGDDVLLLTEVVEEAPVRPAAAPAGTRTVDELMAELLRPMLRQWVDANLPALVERLVRAEVERLVRSEVDRLVQAERRPPET